jgi:glycerate-2-kinase
MLFKNKKQLINNGQTPELKKVRSDILEIFKNAIKAVDPYNAVKSRFSNNKIFFDDIEFDVSKFKDIYLISFGKASIGMAKAVTDSIKIKDGVVITNDPSQKIDNENVSIFVGGHPIPNELSINGADKAIEITKKCEKNDLLIILISGGGSALLAKPRVELKDLQKTTDLLLKSGANINEINTIRKHLSFVKGGQLIKDVKCQTLSLIISDIIGDPLEFIASGPTYPDSTKFVDADKIIKKYKLEEKLPTKVIKIIKDGTEANIPETPKPGDKIFEKVENFIVANNNIACKAASEKATQLGYIPLILTTSLDGEAKTVGKYLVEKAENHISEHKKIAFISGGETTVTIKGKGKGGRNQEMVLSTVEDLSNKNIVFSSFATDGVDGTSKAAGAIADSFSYKRAKEKKLDFNEFLKDNNSYEFFKILDDALLTNPTGTNVMDIQAIIKF